VLVLERTAVLEWIASATTAAAAVVLSYSTCRTVFLLPDVLVPDLLLPPLLLVVRLAPFVKQLLLLLLQWLLQAPAWSHAPCSRS
jgi:hypothetical protein